MIESLKDLEKLLKLCRKQGVTELTLGTTSIKLGEISHVPHGTMISEEPEDIYDNFPDGILTAEQLTHYANGGTPQEDPVLMRELSS